MGLAGLRGFLGQIPFILFVSPALSWSQICGAVGGPPTTFLSVLQAQEVAGLG